MGNIKSECCKAPILGQDKTAKFICSKCGKEASSVSVSLPHGEGFGLHINPPIKPA